MIWPVGFNASIEQHIRDIEIECHRREALQREQWYHLEALAGGGAPVAPRALIHRAGDLLIGAGERLHAWSAPRQTCR